MTLLFGTRSGVYRAAPDALDDAVRVLDSEPVSRLRRFEDRTYAATQSGLYRSTDGGRSWNGLEDPKTEVYSVLEAPPGERLYAGTRPPHLYVSDDGGTTWERGADFEDVPGDARRVLRRPDERQVRTLGAATDRLVAGIEVGGVHYSDDGGRTWRRRSEGVDGDVHHVLVREANRWIASTGDGLYRTRDAGRTWTRLDEALDRDYFREAFVNDGRLYAAGASGPPATWEGPRGTDAALYESDDEGDTLESIHYAGAPGEFVISWTATQDDVYAGTTAGGILRRDVGGWIGVGSVSSEIRSMTVA